MHVETTPLRAQLRDMALEKALQKWSAGVPTCTVPEAAALMSVSAEFLYNVIKQDAFPAVRIQHGDRNGRYVVPTEAIRQLLDTASDAGSRVTSSEFTQKWQAASGDAA